MTRRRGALSLRSILIGLSLAGGAYVALVAIELRTELRPVATEIRLRVGALMRDHDAIAATLQELRLQRRRIAQYIAPTPAIRDSQVAVLRSASGALLALLEHGAAAQTSLDGSDLPDEMRVLLAQALGQEAEAAANAYDAARSVMLGNDVGAVKSVRASTLAADSTALLLSAAQRIALRVQLAQEDALLSRIARLQELAAWWLVGGLFLFLVGAWILQQRFIRPVRAMEGAVQRIAEGALETRVAVTHDDELGRLSSHFNAMTVVLQERAEDESRRRENLTERFGRLLDESANEICVFDATTLRAIQANRGARVNLGYARPDVRELTLHGLLREMEPATLDAQLDRLRSGAQPRLFISTRQTRRDGSSYPVEMSLQYSTDGDSAVFVTVTEDAGARQRARSLDQRLRDFALAEQRALSDGDLRVALRAITPMAAELLGAVRVCVFRQEGERRRCLESFDTRSGEHEEGRVVEARETMPGNPRLEVPVRSGGHVVAMLLLEPPLATHAWSAEEQVAAGGVADIVGRAFESAERRALEHALARAQRMDSIGKLAGGIAHDFNNILTAILGNLDAARATLAPGDPMESSLAEAEHAAQRAADLTRQLLTFSRHQVVESQVVDLNLLTTESDRLLRRLVGEQIELRTELEPRLSAVRLGAGQFEQVLVNLVVNARDAMPMGGRITISTRLVTLGAAYVASHPAIVPGTYVELAVQDTGAGMTRETVERVFEPFFTTKDLGKGTGLGLAVCYGIVRQAGGDISVYSEEGRGSVFRVHLPALAELPEPASGPSSSSAIGGSETILVVEDERAIRDILVRTLTKRGYQVIEASDGREALEVAAAHPGRIDLLVSDVVMPRLGGPEAARELRASRPGLPVLFMSGYTAEASLVGDALAESAFVTKPFTPEQLSRRVRDLLDRSSAD